MRTHLQGLGTSPFQAIIARDALRSPKKLAISFKLGSLDLHFVKRFQFHSLSSCKSFAFNILSLASRMPRKSRLAKLSGAQPVQMPVDLLK